MSHSYSTLRTYHVPATESRAACGLSLLILMITSQYVGTMNHDQKTVT